jgi:hypothetical protein
MIGHGPVRSALSWPQIFCFHHWRKKHDELPQRCIFATAASFSGNIFEKLLAFSAKATRFLGMQSAFCGKSTAAAALRSSILFDTAGMRDFRRNKLSDEG